MNELGNAKKQEVGRWANNRVENSHLPFRRRKRAMLRFRRMKTLQKFPSVHANATDGSREVFKHFAIEEVETTYTTSTATSGGGKRVKELIVTSA